MHLDDKEIIYTIRAYENSAEVPEEDQVTFLDSNRKAHLIPGDDKAKDFIDYAEKCLDYLRFGDEVDEATCGALPPFEQLKVCDTPNCLLAAGFEQKPMLYTQRHLEMAIHPKSPIVGKPSSSC